jgi:hypothetical protein
MVSWRSKICDKVDCMTRQVLIVFCFGEFFLSLLTFNEARVRGFLIMNELIHGGACVKRSLLLAASLEGVLFLFLIFV